MKLIPTLNPFNGTLAKFLSSTRKFSSISQLFVKEEPHNFYLGNEVDVPSALMPFQTAVKTHRLVTQNATGSLTVAQLKAGVITSTSAAAVTATLPTATTLATALKAARGTWYEFAVDNSAGANAVTLGLATGITAATAVITGGDSLVTAAGAVGIFRLYFTSATVAKIYRVG